MASNPDVRIRLSAEGVQEVVNALKQVQAQSQKTAAGAKSVGGGFDVAAKGVAGMQASLAPLLPLLATVASFSFAKGLVDSAEQLGRASKQTGIAVAELSRLAYAAKTTRVETEALYDALNDFGEKMFDAAAGSGDGADALKAMGFSADYAKKNVGDMPKILDDIADKFASYADNSKKTTLATKLFGDAGKDLVPLLSLGAAGMRQLKDESDQLGATLSDSAVAEATKFNTELSRLSAAATSAAQNIMGPLLGAVNKFIGRIKQAREDGTVTSFLGAVFKNVGYQDDLAAAEADVARFEKAAMARQNLSPDDEVFQYLQLARRNRAELVKAKAEAEKLTQGTKPARDTRPSAPDLAPANDAEDAKKAAQARAAATVAASERELALLRVRNAMTDAVDRAKYDDSLTSLTKYHADRLARLEAENAKELQVAQRQVAAAKAIALAADASDADKVNKNAAVKAADDNLAQVRVQNSQRVADAERARLTELKALNIERASVELQQLAASGQREAAAIQSLDAEIQKYEELLKKLGESEEAIKRLTGAQRSQGVGRIGFDTAKENGTKKLGQLDEQKAGVERDLSTGKLWGFEAEAKILEIERQRIPVLQEMQAQLMAASEASQDPALIEQARQMSVAIEDAKAKTDEYGIAMAQLKSGGFDAATQGFETFLNDIASGNKSISDSFQSLAGSVVQALQQMLIKMIAVKAMQAAMSMFGGGGGAAAGAAASVAAATGGHITGPGSGTSDSIPAWLSNGEFVVRAAAVNAVGLDALHEINRRGRLPAARVSAFSSAGVSRFADGGLVGGGQGSQGGGASSLTVGLDDGLVLKKLQSPAGQKLILEAIGQQRRAVRQIIS